MTTGPGEVFTTSPLFDLETEAQSSQESQVTDIVESGGKAGTGFSNTGSRILPEFSRISFQMGDRIGKSII